MTTAMHTKSTTKPRAKPPKARASAGDRTPTPAQVSRARRSVEAGGGAPTFHDLLRRLYAASCKLDIIVKSRALELKGDTEQEAQGLITSEVAQDVDALYVDLEWWGVGHPEAMVQRRKAGEAPARDAQP